ncbi:MAG: hypothetical protein R3B98_04195 [Hyphomonas sp.]
MPARWPGRGSRSGFIEGKSPFSSNNGILVNSEEEAVAAVDWYADQGDFWQIKIYNSMNPALVPAIVKRAHERGLRVTGHVPAFTDANHMIEAGYDEMTHINQYAGLGPDPGRGHAHPAASPRCSACRNSIWVASRCSTRST